MGGALKKVGVGLVKIGTGGIVDAEKGRFNVPFSGAANRNALSGGIEDIGRAAGVRGLGKVVSDAGKIVTYGLVNPEKGRVNVPFSSAMVRDAGKGWANLGTAGQFRDNIDRELDTPTARTVGTGIGSALGAVAGYGAGGVVGPAVGVASGTAGLAGAAAGGYAAQQVNQAGDAQAAERKNIADASQAQQELERQLKQAEDAKLAVQTREAEERRRRTGKQAQTVLTGYSGLGSKAPSYTQTLSPGTARKSVLG